MYPRALSAAESAILDKAFKRRIVRVESSFLRLFGQSRYAADEDSQAPRQNRRELFAVAAVAFTAKHDANFARDFLVRAAGVPKSDLNHDFNWEPQKSFCADLAITDQSSTKRYVVEFKVGARLMEKQDARSKAFNKPGGYGYAFKNRLSGVNVYTTLAQQRDFDDFGKDGREHRTRTWKELIPTNRKESSLEKDLLDSLGELGISVLRLRKVKNMKNANHATTTVNIHDLLRSILGEFREVPLDVDSNEAYNLVGMNLAPRAKQHSDLRKWLGHNWTDIGWIGYLLPKANRKAELSVWLYFEARHAQQREGSIQVLKRKLRGKTVKPSGANDLIVSEAADRVANEKEWFTETLEIVLKNSVATLSRSQKRSRYARGKRGRI
jgi:hypothetical protein